MEAIFDFTILCMRHFFIVHLHLTQSNLAILVGCTFIVNFLSATVKQLWTEGTYCAA